MELNTVTIDSVTRTVKILTEPGGLVAWVCTRTPRFLQRYGKEIGLQGAFPRSFIQKRESTWSPGKGEASWSLHKLVKGHSMVNCADVISTYPSTTGLQRRL